MVWDEKNELGRNLGFKTRQIRDEWNMVQQVQQGTHNLGFKTHVIFETDSKSVVDAIYHFHGGNSEFSMLVSNITSLLSCNQNFVVKFIKRQINMAAHTLFWWPVLGPVAVLLRHYLFVLLL
jgi:hypothetical protein